MIMKKSKGKPIILAVDDDAFTLQALIHVLSERYIVHILANPTELKSILTEQTIKPDLFLLDYLMPVLSGFDLIPIIREFPEHKNTPIVFLTSVNTIDCLSAAISLGANDFLSKPFNDSILFEKIEEHLKESKKDSQI